MLSLGNLVLMLSIGQDAGNIKIALLCHETLGDVYSFDYPRGLSLEQS